MNQMVSVIVPIFNKERYISRCLDSILGQTYTDVEVVIYDDASTDHSFQICESYRKKYPFVKLLRNPDNRIGPGRARKTACQSATGKYICFADADDCLEPEMIEKMVERQLQTEAEIVCCGYTENYQNGKKICRAGSEDYLELDEDNNGRKDLLEKIFFDPDFASYFWNKMFLRDFLIQNIELFSEKECFEDLDTLYKIALKCKKVACLKDPCYHYYRYTGESIMSGWNEQASMDFINTYQNAMKLIVKQYPEMEGLMTRACLTAILRGCKAVLKMSHGRCVYAGQRMCRECLKEYPEWKDCMRGSDRIQMYIVLYIPWIMRIALKGKAVLYG